MALAEDTRNLNELADVDPDEILDRLNDSIARRMPTYQDLYLRWERLNWRVSDLDFERDRSDWLSLDDAHKERLLWTLASFYVAEQRVAATITPYVVAAPWREQKIFLATQCVDESRHTVFFDRWFDEVVTAGESSLSSRLELSRRWVGPGFAPLFDEYLEDLTSRLRDEPDDLALFAKAVAVYHIVVEGVLALTGQKFILAWARDNAILPGFRAGFTAVARDESRHVAFGARVLRDLLTHDPKLIGPVHEGLRESLALGTRLYQPPNGDVTYTSAFGYSLGDLFNYGGIQFEKKMRAIGIPAPDVDVHLPELDAPWPPPGGGLVPVDIRQRLTSRALRAFGRVAPGFAPGVSMMLLHLAFLPEQARSVDVTYEFDLTGPGGGIFTVVINDGECRISIGRSERTPDVLYRMEAATWLAMSEGRATGDEAVLLGKLRITGDVELGRKFNDFFAPPGDPAVGVRSPGNGARVPSPIDAGTRLVARVFGRRRAA